MTWKMKSSSRQTIHAQYALVDYAPQKLYYAMLLCPQAPLLHVLKLQAYYAQTMPMNNTKH